MDAGVHMNEIYLTPKVHHHCQYLISNQAVKNWCLKSNSTVKTLGIY